MSFSERKSDDGKEKKKDPFRNILLGTVGSSNSPSSSSESSNIFTDNPNDSRSFRDVTPPSLTFLAPKDTVCALINTLKMEAPFDQRLLDLKKNFESTIHLVRQEEYEICIFPPSSKNIPKQNFINLKQLGFLKILKKPKRAIEVGFRVEKNTARLSHFSVQFKFDRQFEFFSNVLFEILKINENSKKIEEIEGEEYENSVIYEIPEEYCNLSISKSYEIKIPKKPPKNILPEIYKLSNNVIKMKKNFPHFFRIPIFQWRPIHYIHFLQHTYIQPLSFAEQSEMNSSSSSSSSSSSKSKSKSSENSFMILFDFLESSGFLEDFEEFICKVFRSLDSSPDIYTNKNSKFEKTLFFHISNEIKVFEIKKHCDSLIQRIFEIPNLLYFFKDLCEYYDKYVNLLFPINRFFVLQKRIKQILESQNKANINKEKIFEYTSLEKILSDLDLRQNYWFDVRSCRCHILSLLLFQKPIDTWIDERTQAFKSFLKENLTPCITPNTEESKSNILYSMYFLQLRYSRNTLIFDESKMEVEWGERDDFELLLDDKVWQNTLDKFNKQNFFNLEELSFDIHLAKRRNEMRKILREEYLEVKYKSLNNVEENYKNIILQNQFLIKHLSEELVSLEKKSEQLNEESVNILCSEDPNINIDKKSTEIDLEIEKIDRLIIQKSKELTAKKVELKKLEKEKNENIPKRREIIFSEKSEIQKNLEKEILEYFPEMKKSMRFEFLNSQKRKKEIEELLGSVLENMQEAKQGMSEFSVKLVISIKPSYVAGRVTRNIMKVVDRLVSPNFYQWGIVHASVQMNNIAFHWVGDELVVFEEMGGAGKGQGIYEDIIAVDCRCPLIVSKNGSILERLTKLSYIIVDACVNKKYSFYKIFSLKSQKSFDSIKVMNCQEFAFALINTLGSTQFFDVVETYLEDLKKILQKMETQKSYNLRFLKITKKFRKEFGGQDGLFSEGNSSSAGLFGSIGSHELAKLPDSIIADVSDDEEEIDDNFQKEQESRRSSKFDVINNRVYFNSHKDVDLFYEGCCRINEDFPQFYPGEHQLLKGFDRAFWLIFKRNEERDDVKPILDNLGKVDCPFCHVDDVQENKLEKEDKNTLGGILREDFL